MFTGLFVGISIVILLPTDTPPPGIWVRNATTKANLYSIQAVQRKA
jgi:hypothetical protein